MGSEWPCEGWSQINLAPHHKSELMCHLRECRAQKRSVSFGKNQCDLQCCLFFQGDPSVFTRALKAVGFWGLGGKGPYYTTCLLFLRLKILGTSGQDGGVGRYTLPPHTTKRGQLLKTKNFLCQKIELYGSPTTKELRKKHSPRPVGGAETGSWGGEDSRQGGG